MLVDLFENVVDNTDILLETLYQIKEFGSGQTFCFQINEEPQNYIEMYIQQICQHLYSNNKLYIEYWVRSSFQYIEMHQDIDERVKKDNICPIKGHILSLLNPEVCANTWIFLKNYLAIVPVYKNSLTIFDGSLWHAVPKFNEDIECMRPVILFNIWDKNVSTTENRYQNINFVSRETNVNLNDKRYFLFHKNNNKNENVNIFSMNRLCPIPPKINMQIQYDNSQFNLNHFTNGPFDINDKQAHLMSYQFI